MPLPSPILDDRSYQQLRDELVRRIPIYAPEWSNHNASDPGITLIELFAFLGENLLYRFNQIPDATYLAFLKLLQVPLRPAQTARTLVTLARTDGGGAAVLVPMGTVMRAGSISFESLTEISAWPLEVTAVARIAAPEPASGETRDYALASIDARGGLKPGEQAAYYITQVVPDDPTAPSTRPVDFGATVDHAIWIAIRKTKTTDTSKLGKALLNIGFIPDPVVPTIDQINPCPGEGATQPGAEVNWEASTGEIQNGEARYIPVTVEADTTRGLSQQGVVRLRLPDDITKLGLYPLTDPDLQGTGGFPPVLEDQQLAANVLFWLRATRRDLTRPFGGVQYIGINTTEVVQTIKAKPEFVGIGDAQADQTFKLVHKPVIEDSAKIQVEEPDGWTDWLAVDGFEISQEDSRHYVIDLEAGTIRFGNGVHGRAPQIGERIRAVEYRYGGGVTGNVGAKAISQVTDVTGVKAANPIPAVGGAPGESIAEALERVPGELRRHDRAVTRGDFQELALMTPGADVGRADCLPLFDPRTKNLHAAGVVSVVVWPREDLKNPNAPMPDQTLLRKVCCWLDARRLVTTELNVIPPTYRKVAVAVGLQAKPGYGIEAVRRWVELVIRQYLAPLPPYGPEGGGWPLGRSVYGPELEAAALQVEGVQFVECLRLARWDDTNKIWKEAAVDPTTGEDGCPPRERVDLQAWEVPELAEITVVQGQPLKPGDALGPVPSPLIPIPIPTIREEC